MGNHRGSRPAPPLTEALILAWSDAYFARTGFRPHRQAGAAALPAGESWAALDAALRVGCRGLPGGDTLRELLRRYRPGMRRRVSLRKPDQARRALVAELRAKRLSLSQIGARLGVSRQGVSSMLQRIGTEGNEGGA
jgi:hypothetical protein